MTVLRHLQAGRPVVHFGVRKRSERDEQESCKHIQQLLGVRYGSDENATGSQPPTDVAKHALHLGRTFKGIVHAELHGYRVK